MESLLIQSQRTQEVKLAWAGGTVGMTTTSLLALHHIQSRDTPYLECPSAKDTCPFILGHVRSGLPVTLGHCLLSFYIENIVTKHVDYNPLIITFTMIYTWCEITVRHQTFSDHFIHWSDKISEQIYTCTTVFARIPGPWFRHVNFNTKFSLSQFFWDCFHFFTPLNFCFRNNLWHHKNFL